MRQSWLETVMTFDPAVLLQFWPLIIKGFAVTIALFALSTVLSLILGVVIALIRQSRFVILIWFAVFYIELVRNIPFMIQLYLVFFLRPYSSGIMQLQKQRHNAYPY